MRDEEIIVFLGIAVLITAFFLVYVMGKIFSHKENMAKIRSQASSETDSTKQCLNELLQRMEKIERRVANVETLVLESEKHRQFEQSL